MNEASRVATPASKQKRVRLVTVRFFFLVDNATLSYDLTFIGERAKYNNIEFGKPRSWNIFKSCRTY